MKGARPHVWESTLKWKRLAWWEVWWFPPFLHAAKSWWPLDPLAVIQWLISLQLSRKIKTHLRFPLRFDFIFYVFKNVNLALKQSMYVKESGSHVSYNLKIIKKWTVCIKEIVLQCISREPIKTEMLCPLGFLGLEVDNFTFNIVIFCPHKWATSLISCLF